MADHPELAHRPSRCTPADAGIEMLPGLPEEDVAALNAYFWPFAAPVTVQIDGDRRIYCLSCGQEINSFRQMFSIGVAMMWGLTHGEATCTGCGWPARGMHYVKREDGTEVCTIRNLFLQYHPDEVSVRQPSTGKAA